MSALPHHAFSPLPGSTLPVGRATPPPEDQAMTDASLSPSRLRARQEDRLMFRLLFAVSFPFFLVTTIAVRVIGSDAGFAAGGKSLSILGQARAAADAAIPYAFMG